MNRVFAFFECNNVKTMSCRMHAYYNFVKSHISIRCTPAMAAGVENSAWTVRDLVARIEG